jgi:hypothetical protein
MIYFFNNQGETMKKSITFTFLIFCLALISTSSFASGKQIRPPKIDVCDIDPDSEGCEQRQKSLTREVK